MFLLTYSFPILSQSPNINLDVAKKEIWKSTVIATKHLKFDSFPNAFNPSIARTNLGLLLTFRFCPNPKQPWVSQIGIVPLDEISLEPIGNAQILKFHSQIRKSPSQAEDARIFGLNGKTYIIYNDNVNDTNPSIVKRRDMFIGEVTLLNGTYSVSKSVRLYHHSQYENQKWQKNWVPFEWSNTLFLSYTLDPHEVILPNLSNGKCLSAYNTPPNSNWLFGKIRGGTPALLLDGEYLAFFHSSICTKSPVSTEHPRHHYFMGAYTFSANPPFNITKITQFPLVGEGFYVDSDAEKRVIFPGGYVISEPYLHIAYGKDDREIGIATIDIERLKLILEPVNKEVDFTLDQALNELLEDKTVNIN